MCKHLFDRALPPPGVAPSRSMSTAAVSRFSLAARGTDLRTEVGGGIATFLTMSYIVFVNPAILSAAGLPFGAVAICTALGAAIFTALMGLTTNLPFALAPGLGLNAVVAFDLILGRELSPATAMACILLEGLIAVVLVLAGLREAIMRAVPQSLKLAIGVGIGIFIALVGLREGGITVNNDATGIGLGDLSSGPALIALAGIFVALAMTGAQKRGAIIAGIATSLVLGLIFGVLDGPDGVTRLPKGGDFDLVGDAVRRDRRRADRRPDPGHLHPLHDGLLRHGRDGVRGRHGRRPGGRQGRAAQDAPGAAGRLGGRRGRRHPRRLARSPPTWSRAPAWPRARGPGSPRW